MAVSEDGYDIMLDKTRRKTAIWRRKGENLGMIEVEPFPLDANTAKYAYMNGLKIDFQAYIPTSHDIHLFDELEIDGERYVLNQIVCYETFCYVVGERVEVSN